MDFNLRTENDCSVINLGGRLDAVTAPDCEQRTRDLIGAGNLRIVIDFSGLEYISSAGLRALLVIAKLIKEKNGQVCFANVQGNVQSVFEMSGFTSLFQIRNSVAEALQALA